MESYFRNVKWKYTMTASYGGTNGAIKDHSFAIRNLVARYEAEQCTLFDPVCTAPQLEVMSPQ